MFGPEDQQVIEEGIPGDLTPSTFRLFPPMFFSFLFTFTTFRLAIIYPFLASAAAVATATAATAVMSHNTHT